VMFFFSQGIETRKILYGRSVSGSEPLEVE